MDVTVFQPNFIHKNSWSDRFACELSFAHPILQDHTLEEGLMETIYDETVW